MRSPFTDEAKYPTASRQHDPTGFVYTAHMGWFNRLFGSDKPAVIVETGTAHPEQAQCVHLSGAYIVDLRPLPSDRARVIGAIADIAAQIERAPEPIQVWVASNRVLEAFDGADALMELTDALFAATKRVEPKMIVEKDAPEATVYLLRSLGFEVFLPGLKLTTVDARGAASELDVMKELEKLRSVPRLRA